MADQIHDLGNGFWNIQGTFKIGGLVDIGTQCSLVQLASGKFIFLDSYCLKDDVRAVDGTYQLTKTWKPCSICPFPPSSVKNGIRLSQR